MCWSQTHRANLSLWIKTDLHIDWCNFYKYRSELIRVISRTSKSIFIIWAPYRAITSSLFVLCYVCRTAGSAQKKRSLLVAQTLSKALNKAFRSIPGAALRFNLHLKTSAPFFNPFLLFSVDFYRTIFKQT